MTDAPKGSAAGTAIALTIAGSDSSGGAGIQADLKTFQALGVYGASAITALTAQNTQGVRGVEACPPAFVAEQIAAVLDDLDVGAIKTGMLANAPIVRAVVDSLRRYPRRPLVVDPVMVATSGDVLLAGDAIDGIIEELFPLATLITPNLPEAARLLRCPMAAGEAEAVEQARALLALGPAAVLVKGGHGAGGEAVDVLVRAGHVRAFARPRVDTPHTHGTGCTLSAAIAAELALGRALEDAVAAAKTYVWEALMAGRTLGVGKGHGPVDHLYRTRGARAG
ncbi:MAG: bifunctional hydroxymethylpyrimidine kinase/phosphomethylpyrimidine kinase [Hyphomicrobiaceae bacterium]|nr:bifunctional hydroxymethylpyrimidine kinase/phosphomethylpyrimidine kinase [Hyphomicrobiaceae bacterium]